MPAWLRFRAVVPGEGATPAIADHLNAGFAVLDARAAAAAAGLPKNGAEGEARHADPKAWQRTMDVTMAGPRYLSLLATDADNCAARLLGATSGVVLPLVYDLTTGAPVNWVKLMPAGVRASLATAEDGTRMGVVEWPALQARALRESTPDCKVFIRENGILDFAVWLDGGKGELVAETVSFPNAGAGCEVPIRYTTEQMRQMGFDKDLIASLETAKAAAPAHADTAAVK